jgi:hypothetical protein
MAFKEAQRTQLWLRCALFGPSGSGKTMTALRMAKGISDKMGVPFAVIDTEARSASKYADRFKLIVDDLNRKTIDDYIASMNEAARAGYKILVIDSLSHAWRELTEEVDRITQASQSKNSLLSWGRVGPKQKRLVEAILNYPGHVIATMRSKTEWVIGQGKNGKSAPEKLGLAPEQGKGIEYEFDLLVEMNQEHQAIITKDRTGQFQDKILDKPGEDFGVDLYNWLSAGSAPPPAAMPPVQQYQQQAPAYNPAPASNQAGYGNYNNGYSAADQTQASGKSLYDQIRELAQTNQAKFKPAHFEWIMNQLNEHKTESQLNGLMKHVKGTLDKGGDAEPAPAKPKQAPKQAAAPKAPATAAASTAASPSPQNLEEQGNRIIQEIENLVSGFSVGERNRAMQLVKGIHFDADGIEQLDYFRRYLSDESLKKAA